MWSLGVLWWHQALIMSCEESGTRPWRCILITFVEPFRSTPFLLGVFVKNIWILKRVLCIWLLIRLSGYQVNKPGLSPLPLPLEGCGCWAGWTEEALGLCIQRGEAPSLRLQSWGAGPQRFRLISSHGHRYKWLSSCQEPTRASPQLCQGGGVRSVSGVLGLSPLLTVRKHHSADHMFVFIVILGWDL